MRPPTPPPRAPPVSALDWPRLSPLLDDALALTAQARAGWLSALAQHDAAAAATLGELLARQAQADAQGFLEGHAPGLLLAASRAAEAGMRCGAYRLVAPIGAGGMGVVWRGERADGHFERTVAIKLLHLDLLPQPQAIAQHLQREAAILARLSHPQIAALIDAGVADHGQPYLVLEFVAGRRIDEACDALGLPLAQRLALFVDVLAAVAHAHAHLVVHRDLKPANVLLSNDGRSVKLLDFGIAALLAGPGDATGPVTQGPRALTPRYAAPEQLHGGPITTATDIYALGLLLQSLAAGAPDAAAARADIDPIVARATAADPAARYATAAALADDIRRHLRGEPVAARPARWRYTAGRFVRRHRAAVAAAVLGGAALVATAAVAVTQAHEAHAQRDEALQRQRAAEAVRSFASNMMTLAGADGRPLSAEQVVDHAEALARRLYASQPAVLAELLMMVAAKNTVLQRRPARERNYADAAALAAASGDAPLQALTACFAVPMDAADAAPRVSTMARALPAEPRFARARHHCHSFAATLAAWDGRLADAQAHAAASEAALSDLDLLRPLLQADLHETRGDVARAGGHLASADAHYAAALRAETEASGGRASNLLTAQRLNYRQLMHLQIGLPQQALALSDELQTLLLGMNTAHDLPAYMHSNRGVALMQLGSPAEAEDALRQAVRRGEQTGSLRYQFGAQARLAELLLDQGRTAEAAPLVQAVVAFNQREPGAATQATARLVQARQHLAAGAATAAAAAAAAALDSAGENAFLLPLRGQAHLLHAQALLADGRAAASASAARRALAIARQMAGPHAQTLHGAHAGIALARALAQQKPGSARQAAGVAAGELAAVLGPAHAETAAARALAASL